MCQGVSYPQGESPQLQWASGLHSSGQNQWTALCAAQNLALKNRRLCHSAPDRIRTCITSSGGRRCIRFNYGSIGRPIFLKVSRIR